MMNRLATSRLDAAFAKHDTKDAKKAAPAHGTKSKHGNPEQHLHTAVTKHKAGDHQGAKIAALKAVQALHLLTGKSAAAEPALAPDEPLDDATGDATGAA